MRKYNYSAFYVAEPFSDTGLGANTAPDFRYYNLLKGWKAQDPSFPFHDAHATTYSVRDGSDWETTLKPRLHERLRNSRNIILFLSSNTKYSRALKEEIDYGINTLGLPIIVVYPEMSLTSEIVKNGKYTNKVTNLWEKLPVFRDNKYKVPVLHVPLSKSLISRALSIPNFSIVTKEKEGEWYL